MKISAAAFIFSLFVFIPAYAQSQTPETEANAEIKYDQTLAEEEVGGSVSGVVVSVNPAAGSFALRDADEDGSVYYLTVKKATTFAGISSLADINPGDSISVDCYGAAEQMIAETITLQDRAYAQEELPKLQKVLSD